MTCLQWLSVLRTFQQFYLYWYEVVNRDSHMKMWITPIHKLVHFCLVDAGVAILSWEQAKDDSIIRELNYILIWIWANTIISVQSKQKRWADAPLGGTSTTVSERTELNFTCCGLSVRNEWHHLIWKGFSFSWSSFWSRMCGWIKLKAELKSIKRSRAYATGLSKCFRVRCIIVDIALLVLRFLCKQIDICLVMVQHVCGVAQS